MRGRLESYFSDYAEAHQTSGNKWTHYFGIPMISFSLLGLLDRLAIGPVTGAHFLAAFALGFYLWLSPGLGLGMGVVLALFGWGAAHTPLSVLWVLFVVGWVLQFIGHYAYEKKSPKFLRNVLHVFVGPLWIFAGLLRRGQSGRLE